MVAMLAWISQAQAIDTHLDPRLGLPIVELSQPNVERPALDNLHVITVNHSLHIVSCGSQA